MPPARPSVWVFWPLLLSSACAPARSSRRAPPTEPPPAPAAAPGAPGREAALADPLVAPPPAGSSAGVEAPLELDQDLALRRAEAERELGPKISTQLVAGVYLVVGAPGWGKAQVSESALFIDRALTGYFHGRFERRPSRALPIYLFGDAARYQAFCRRRWRQACISKYGFFDPLSYMLVMNVGLGLGTLSHELVHPIVEVDFPAAPIWINEGLASLFEAPLMPRRGEIHGAKNWRHPRLLAALGNPADRAEATLARLFLLSDEAFRDDREDLHYAMARYLCQWLDQRGALWPFYQRWRDHAAEDPTGEVSFREVVGASPAEADAPWARWVRAL